jgi:ribosomal-protein-alanine N-acetyltransferase
MIELNFSPFPVLETERLILRRITMEDAEDFFAMRSEREGAIHLDRELPKSIDEIHKLIESIEEGITTNKLIAWAVTEKNNSKFIGQICFHKTYPQHHRAEIGYQLRKEFWRKGYTDEAVKCLIDYGFNTMNLHSIEAHTNPNNAASINLLLKNGFVQEALFRENYFYKGKFLDTPVFSLVNRK